MLYSVLTLTGNYTVEEIKKFRQWGSPTPGHPELDIMRGIENTSGPLGQGHTMAVGAAIAERFLVASFGGLFDHKIFIYLRRRYTGGDFTGCGPHRRPPGTEQPYNVL